jgi:hypothetical protein
MILLDGLLTGVWGKEGCPVGLMPNRVDETGWDGGSGPSVKLDGSGAWFGPLRRVGVSPRLIAGASTASAESGEVGGAACVGAVGGGGAMKAEAVFKGVEGAEGGGEDCKSRLGGLGERGGGASRLLEADDGSRTGDGEEGGSGISAA